MPVDFGQRPISVTRAAAVPDVVPGASCEPEIDFVQNPSAGASDMKRSLAIEELGTSFQVEKRVPLVRLKGHWLKAAGFTAGKRVTVTCLSPGVMELRAETVSATLNLILGGAPEGKLDLLRAVPEGSRAGVRGLAEAPTGSAVPAGLAPGLVCARWLQAAAWAVPNGTRWVIRRVFPSATAGLPLASPPGKSASHRNRLPIPVVRPRTSPPNRESMKTQLELARQCLTLAGTPFTEEALTGNWIKLRIQNTPGKCPEENLRQLFPSSATFDSTGNLVAVS